MSTALPPGIRSARLVAVLDGYKMVGYREISEADVDTVDELLPEITMTKAEMETYRRQLTDLRERLNGDVAHLANEALRKGGGEASGSLSNTPIHMADLGTDNFEQENTLNLLQNEEQVLSQIAEALERMQQGVYGRCDECESEIPKARLKELPYTRYCVECARKLEQHS
ncbi:MAG TPA: TraR/DksA family transcriptional regulator [Gemmataceae bacterium]|nr:TraR/DksA family transcriptional regulator [Gemmataceae bacterium]